MKARKWTHGTIGTVSHATMRTQDLIPAFCNELRYLGHRSKKLTIIDHRASNAKENDPYWGDELAQWDLESLFDMLNEHSLPHMYFGSHPGDSSDYGFWISKELEYDFDGLKVNDTIEIPSNYIGEVLHVNDHGNMTLYWKSSRKLKEIWSVV